jgi:trans-aconitate 2-methyltransferase
MIQKATQDYPNQEWIVNDFCSYEFDRKFDLVFSNAAIQWMPNHLKLIRKIRSLLAEKGVAAVQIPQFWEMPLGKIIDKTAKYDRWRKKTENAARLFTIHNYSFYYDALAQLFESVEIWVTDYLHVLNNHASIMEMMRSTGLKPYHESLNDDSDIKEFDEMVLKEIIIAYPEQNNGKVILPFKRLFFIAYT